MGTAYTALGVSETATGEEIARAWKEKRRRFGSMRTGLRGADLSPADEARERLVNHAYEKLGKPTTRENYPDERKAYDRWLANSREQIALDTAAKTEMAAKAAEDSKAARAATRAKAKPSAKPSQANPDPAKKRRDEIYANTRKPRNPSGKPSGTSASASRLGPHRSAPFSSVILFVIALVGAVGGIKLLNSLPVPAPPTAAATATVAAEPTPEPTALRAPAAKFHKHRHNHGDGAGEVAAANRREAARIARHDIKPDAVSTDNEVEPPALNGVSAWGSPHTGTP